MTVARSNSVDDDVSGFYHCISRCVRRAFLCGWDAFSQTDYEHRRQWIYNRLVVLADLFFIDVCGFSVMMNHLHVILRNRPELAWQASDQEIALRWWRLFPKRRDGQFQPEEPTIEELNDILDGEGRVEELRKRLSSISWFMRCLKEPVARRANKEDECTGRFWEGRFKSIALLDQAAILACSTYVDLNPIRAGLAQTPETSLFTSAYDRILARTARKGKDGGGVHFTKDSVDVQTHDPQVSNVSARDRKKDQWLCPLQDETNRRGYLNISLDDYLSLLDWTGRQIIQGKRGAIPGHLEPILIRLEINPAQWLQSSQYFGTVFYRAAGTLSSLRKAAIEAGRKWFKGKQSSSTLFLDKYGQRADPRANPDQSTTTLVA